MLPCYFNSNLYLLGWNIFLIIEYLSASFMYTGINSASATKDRTEDQIWIFMMWTKIFEVKVAMLFQW